MDIIACKEDVARMHLRAVLPRVDRRPPDIFVVASKFRGRLRIIV